MKYTNININVRNKFQGSNWMLALLLTFFFLPVLAQNRTISGVVTDSKGETLPGVNIIVVGSNEGNITDFDGNFKFTIPENATQLMFSFVGYESKTVDISKEMKILNVELVDVSKELDELVVVGYGQMRKSDLTGAVSSVAVNAGEAQTSQNLQSLLQGRASGVQITSSDAAPGAAISMKIRGTGSLTGISEPLYVVDGIIMNSTMDQNILSGSSGTTTPDQNGLTGINPQDIENFEILKDASATAIYGSLGANGVVLITTKSGKTEQPKMQYSGSLSMSHLTNKRDLMSLEEYISFKQALGEAQGSTKLQELTIDAKFPMDWQSWATREAWSQNHRMNISGKTDKTRYYLSGGFSDNQGIIRSTGNSATDMRINLDQEVTQKLRIGTRSSFTFSKLNMTSGANSNAFVSSGLIRQILTYRPYTPTVTGDDDIEIDYENDDAYGPGPYLNDYEDYTSEYRVLSSVYLNLSIQKWLSMRTTVGVDYRSRTRQQYYGITTSTGRNNRGLSQVSNRENMRLNIDHMFNTNYQYRRSRFDGTFGATATSSVISNRLNVGRAFSVLGYREEGLMYSGSITPPDYREFLTNSLSFLGRVVYSFDNKYVLTSTFRADGTSIFAQDNKFSYFPSFALAYRLDQERFMRQYRWLSNAKLRLGWGMVGNQAIDAYQTLYLYQSNTYANALGTAYYSGFSKESITNPDLRWETTQQYNAGLDLGLFRNRINLTIDVYDKVSYDLLQSLDMPLSSGYDRMFINQGSIRNKGVEISLDVAPVRTKDFSLNIAGNISLNRNEIVDIGLEASQLGAHNWAYFLGRDVGTGSYFKHPANIFIQGQPVALFYGLKTTGIITQEEVDEDRRIRLENYLAANPTVTSGSVTENDLKQVSGTLPVWSGSTIELLQAGDFRYYDTNNDGMIDPETDGTVIGNPNPKFTFGFTIDITYKNFFMTSVFNGVYGNDIANSNRMLEEDIKTSDVTYNATRYIQDNYWKHDRISTTHPRMNYTGEAGRFSSYYIEDGSYLRFSSFTIGHNFNLKSRYFSRLSVNVSGNNLLVLTKYRGYDPEVNSFARDPLRVGIDWSSYPKSRSYALGVTLDF